MFQTLALSRRDRQTSRKQCYIIYTKTNNKLSVYHAPQPQGGLWDFHQSQAMAANSLGKPVRFWHPEKVSTHQTLC